MYFTFSSDRKLSFIINAGGRNLLVQFGDPNSNGVSTFTTKDPKVANAIRKNSLSRRGIICESSESAGKELETGKEVKKVAMPTKETEKTDDKAPAETADEGSEKAPEEREYDNYTVAREAICKEFGINKSTVRNPTALAKVAQEHGIIIKYKEL